MSHSTGHNIVAELGIIEEFFYQGESFYLSRTAHMHQRSGTGNDIIPEFHMLLIIICDGQILCDKLFHLLFDLHQIKIHRLFGIIQHKSMADVRADIAWTLNVPDHIAE